MSQRVKTKRQANFKDFKPLRGSSNKKTYSTRSCVNWAFFWHSWAFKTLVSLAFNNGLLVRKKAQFTHELIK
jgi:hypothetical protein